MGVIWEKSGGCPAPQICTPVRDYHVALCRAEVHHAPESDPAEGQAWGEQDYLGHHSNKDLPKLHHLCHLLCTAAVWSCLFPSRCAWGMTERSGNSRESSTAPSPSKSVTELCEAEDKEMEITYSHNLWQGVALSPLLSLTQPPIVLNVFRTNSWEPAVETIALPGLPICCSLWQLVHCDSIHTLCLAAIPQTLHGKKVMHLNCYSSACKMMMCSSWKRASSVILKVSGFDFGVLVCLSPAESSEIFRGSASLGSLLPVLDVSKGSTLSARWFLQPRTKPQSSVSPLLFLKPMPDTIISTYKHCKVSKIRSETPVLALAQIRLLKAMWCSVNDYNFF